MKPEAWKDNGSGDLPVSIDKHTYRVSGEAPGHDAPYAFDNNVRTWWAAAGDDRQPWLVIDLGSGARRDPVVQEFVIDSVRILFAAGDLRGAQEIGAAPYQYKLEASSDDKTYQTALDKTTNTIEKNVEFEECSPVRCRYVRLTVTGAPTKVPVGIIEFTVFGKPVEAAAPLAARNAERTDHHPMLTLTNTNFGRARLPAFILLVLVIIVTHSFAAVYQYCVPVGTRGRAFLWIPANCTQVRGLIFSMENGLERNGLEDPIIRETAPAEGLGILFLAGSDPGSITWEMKPSSIEATTKMLAELAEKSGYGEIAFAPILWMGHSYHGRTWIFAGAMPERTIAAIPIRTYPMPETSNFAGIPLLYLVGQTTELPQLNAPGGLSDRDYFWPDVRSSSLALRAAELVGEKCSRLGQELGEVPRGCRSRRMANLAGPGRARRTC